MSTTSGILKLIPCLAPLLFATSTYGWGGDGHQIVCLIAEDHLTQAAQDGIHDLLGDDVDISDAEVASWADTIRRSKRYTARWHYVDIPLDRPAFDEARDGHKGSNVIDKVIHFQKVLANHAASATERAEALKYLVHLVGDLHQPLHCADRNDKGGNGRLVFLLGRRRAISLHVAWDTSILLLQKNTTRIADFAEKLDASITDAEFDDWRKGTPLDWANESHGIAATAAYKGVPADGPPPKLDQEYVDRAAAAIDVQLEKAGVRLAKLLNEAFAETPATRPTAR